MLLIDFENCDFCLFGLFNAGIFYRKVFIVLGVSMPMVFIAKRRVQHRRFTVQHRAGLTDARGSELCVPHEEFELWCLLLVDMYVLAWYEGIQNIVILALILNKLFKNICESRISTKMD